MFQRLKAFVKDLSSTNWIIFTGTACGILTCLVYMVCLLFRKEIQLDVWLGWLGFLAGWIGFGVRQFRHKRETNFELERIKQNGKTTVESKQQQ